MLNVPGISQTQDLDQLYQLGMTYAHGEGVPQNYNKAVNYFLKAAHDGHRDSKIRLGEASYLGLGIEKSKASARTFIYAFAQEDSHWWWLEDTIPYDESKTFDDYVLAAQNGDDAAQEYLMNAYSPRLKLTCDNTAHVYWAEKLAAKGCSKAFFALACAYMNGNGVEKNYAKAKELFLTVLEKNPNDIAAAILFAEVERREKEEEGEE